LNGHKITVFLPINNIMSTLYNPLTQPEDIETFLGHARKKQVASVEIYLKKTPYVREGRFDKFGYKVILKAGNRELGLCEETYSARPCPETKPKIEQTIKDELSEKARVFSEKIRELGFEVKMRPALEADALDEVAASKISAVEPQKASA